jgi:hypothetical protein
MTLNYWSENPVHYSFCALAKSYSPKWILEIMSYSIHCGNGQGKGTQGRIADGLRSNILIIRNTNGCSVAGVKPRQAKRS